MSLSKWTVTLKISLSLSLGLNWFFGTIWRHLIANEAVWYNFASWSFIYPSLGNLMLDFRELSQNGERIQASWCTAEPRFQCFNKWNSYPHNCTVLTINNIWALFTTLSTQQLSSPSTVSALYLCIFILSHLLGCQSGLWRLSDVKSFLCRLQICAKEVRDAPSQLRHQMLLHTPLIADVMGLNAAVCDSPASILYFVTAEDKQERATTAETDGAGDVIIFHYHQLFYFLLQQREISWRSAIKSKRSICLKWNCFFLCLHVCWHCV